MTDQPTWDEMVVWAEYDLRNWMVNNDAPSVREAVVVVLKAAGVDSLASALAESRGEVEALRRDWPLRNQVEGLGRSVVALYHLRDLLDLTSTGPSPLHSPGREPSYRQILRHHLDAIERMIVPDYEGARQRWEAALASPTPPTAS